MQQFVLASTNGTSNLACYCTESENPRALVQISHGMTEYFLRYAPFAQFLTSHGFLVFGHDHIGHGKTAETAEGLGFTKSHGGADCMVEDVHNVALHMKQKYPHLPIILFGHSMGSFIAREVLARYGATYTAAVICGTGGPESPVGAGKLLANLIMAFKGERYRSGLLKSIAFLGYNRKYEKGCDPRAWLNRNTEALERYKNDPLCNYTFTARAYHDLFTLVGWVSQKDWAEKIPKDLPILVMSGEMDPVGNFGKGVKAVFSRLQKAGVKDLTLHLYPEMRHEILNEIQFETVWEETKQWMERFKQ